MSNRNSIVRFDDNKIENSMEDDNNSLSRNHSKGKLSWKGIIMGLGDKALITVGVIGLVSCVFGAPFIFLPLSLIAASEALVSMLADEFKSFKVGHYVKKGILTLGSVAVFLLLLLSVLSTFLPIAAIPVVGGFLGSLIAHGVFQWVCLALVAILTFVCTAIRCLSKKLDLCNMEIERYEGFVDSKNKDVRELFLEKEKKMQYKNTKITSPATNKVSFFGGIFGCCSKKAPGGMGETDHENENF